MKLTIALSQLLLVLAAADLCRRFWIELALPGWLVQALAGVCLVWTTAVLGVVYLCLAARDAWRKS